MKNNLQFKVGDSVIFTGFRSASFSYPNIKIGDKARVVSVKEPGRIGMDYGVEMESGIKCLLDQAELKAAK